MFEGLARGKQAVIAGSDANACELLDASAAEDEGAVVAHVLDRANARLIELEWAPGAGFASRWVPLAGEVPEYVWGVSAAGRALVVCGDEKVCLIDRQTGKVATIPGLRTPAAIMPDARAIVSATDEGLLTIGVWTSSMPENAPFAAGIAPLAVADMQDPGCVAVLPSFEADGFDMAVGCLANVALVSVAAFRSSRRKVQVRTVFVDDHTGYDDILLATPSPVLATPGKRFVYAVDGGRVGIAAIDTHSGTTFRGLEMPGEYGRVRRVLPNFSSTACLLGLASAETLLWSPGSEPRPVTLAGGFPALWHDGHALVMDGDTVREIAFAP